MKMYRFFIFGSAVAALLLSAAPALARTAPAARFTYEYDVGLVDSTLWDTVFVGDTYRSPAVTVANYSMVPASVWFELTLLPSGPGDGGFLDPPVGSTHTVSLNPDIYMMVFESTGVYPVMRCSLEWSLDQNPANDTGTKYVVVLPRPGVKGSETACREPHRPVASYSTRVLRAEEPGATWYTTTGSRVPSAAARPGIYFKVQGRLVRRVVLIR